MRHFQFVNWFPEWRGFYFFRWHKDKSDIAYIYDWFLGFMFWEIRKWATRCDIIEEGGASHPKGQ